MEIYKPRVFDFEDSAIFYSALESYFADKILEVNGEVGTVRIALAGGKTPLPMYASLINSASLPLDKLEIYQTDERYVKNTEDTSNQKNISEALTADLEDEIGEINYINTNLPIEQSVKLYNEKILSLDNKDGLFDLVVLGVGADGHIASLFPGGKYLKHQEDYVIQTVAPSEFEIARRISLTLEAILDSKEIALLIKGPEKAAVLGEILDGSLRASEFPAKFLLAHPNLRIYNCIV